MLQKEFSGDARVRLVKGCLEDVADSLSSDSVVLVNVLEHIEDDRALLRTIHRILNPGGTILLFVPALPCLYGSLDEAFGHVRRYTKSALTLRLEKMRFQIVRLQYFNLPGIGPWFLAGKVLKRRSLRPSDVRMYDRWVMPWISRLERRWGPPVGQSILAIARK
jgi:SAM-dependent methyltransferase